ncbi:MAG: hypothetical protein HY926_05865 [Elusimicrobia bacterium]|nr:hypothetical protein [Elusimicrobiota bacterium]
MMNGLGRMSSCFLTALFLGAPAAADECDFRAAPLNDAELGLFGRSGWDCRQGDSPADAARLRAWTAEECGRRPDCRTKPDWSGADHARLLATGFVCRSAGSGGGPPLDSARIAEKLDAVCADRRAWGSRGSGIPLPGQKPFAMKLSDIKAAQGSFALKPDAVSLPQDSSYDGKDYRSLANTRFRSIKPDGLSVPPPSDQPCGDDLMACVQELKTERLSQGHTLDTSGNFKQFFGLAPKLKPGAEAGSGCRDWAEATAGVINKHPTMGKKYEAGVICGTKTPTDRVLPLAQHCVTVYFPKGQDPNSPATDVRYIDAWKTATETGPIRKFLCSHPVAIEQDYTAFPYGTRLGWDHSISFYDLDKREPKELLRRISSAQVNLVFKRGCLSGR